MYESRSTSENCKWGIRTKFKQGILHLNANRFLGYDKDKNGSLVINKEQAVTEKRIFDEFLGGINPETIAKNLNNEKVPGCMGEARWTVTTIIKILENEKYKGEALLQKTFTADFLTKKMVKNDGQLEQIRVKDSHPAIIDPDLWEAAQYELQRRRDYLSKHGLRCFGKNTDEQPFSCKVICAECGNIYQRKTWYRGNKVIKIWQCASRYQEKGVVGCKSGNVREEDLDQGFIDAWNEIVENRDKYMTWWEEKIQNGNAWERLKAKQMMELTKEGKIIRVYTELVNLVLESVIVQQNGSLDYIFIGINE